MYRLGGLPGSVCPCPPYGDICEGMIRAVYPGSDLPDEVATAGEAYLLLAGHLLVYEEPIRALKLNPAFALQHCM